jgi:hypothetical protein
MSLGLRTINDLPEIINDVILAIDDVPDIMSPGLRTIDDLAEIINDLRRSLMRVGVLARLAQVAFDRCDERLDVDRFRDVAVAAGFEEAVLVAAHGVGGQGEDGDARGAFVGLDGTDDREARSGRSGRRRSRGAPRRALAHHPGKLRQDLVNVITRIVRSTAAAARFRDPATALR